MKLKKNLVAFVIALLLCMPIVLPKTVSAQTKPWGGDCISKETINKGTPDEQVIDVATIVGIECMIANILNIGVSAVGIASFVMWIIGSIMYLTSGGDPRKTEVGSKTMSYAAFGLLVSISGWVIINFIATFTGVETIKKIDIEVGL